MKVKMNFYIFRKSSKIDTFLSFNIFFNFMTFDTMCFDTTVIIMPLLFWIEFNRWNTSNCRNLLYELILLLFPFGCEIWKGYFWIDLLCTIELLLWVWFPMGLHNKTSAFYQYPSIIWFSIHLLEYQTCCQIKSN